MDAAVTHHQGGPTCCLTAPNVGVSPCPLLSSHGASLLVVREPPADTLNPGVSSAPAAPACQAQSLSHKHFLNCSDPVNCYYQIHQVQGLEEGIQPQGAALGAEGTMMCRGALAATSHSCYSAAAPLASSLPIPTLMGVINAIPLGGGSSEAVGATSPETQPEGGPGDGETRR